LWGSKLIALEILSSKNKANKENIKGITINQLSIKNSIKYGISAI
jgi:hypothetical protein